MKRKKLVNLENARVDTQRKVMEEIVKDDVCPFCIENFIRYHKKLILRDGKYWLLTSNQWPYEHTKYHFLAVSKKHLETLSELSAEAVDELLEHFQWVVSTYKIPGGSFFMRFGDTAYTGSSVAHLHAQLIMGDHDDPNHQPVKVKLG